MTVVLFVLLAYLLGSFPSSYLVGRLHGVDLRRRGSGNLGGANVYRYLGGGAAALVVAIDVVKGFLPAWFFPQWDAAGSSYWALAYGLAAIAGHVWSVFTRFRGGKGVATAAGALGALAPLAVLIGFLVWLGLVLIGRIVSLASLVAAALVPLVAWIAAAPGSTVSFALGLAAFLWWTHRKNLVRLLRREELRLEPAVEPAASGTPGSAEGSARPEGGRPGPAPGRSPEGGEGGPPEPRVGGPREEGG